MSRESSDSGASLLFAKIVSALVLSSLSISFGLLPFKLTNILKLEGKKKGEEPPVIVSIILYFGAGVLMATTFLHVLPEVGETFKHLETEWLKNFNNRGQLITCIGFFMIYFVEEVAHKFLDPHHAIEICEVEEIPSQICLRSIKYHECHGFSRMSIDIGAGLKTSNFRGFLVVFALSVHELFEGFTMGLSMHTTGVYLMLAGFSLHKCPLAFYIGSELIVQHTKKSTAVMYVVVFATVSGVGILTGAFLTHVGENDTLNTFNGILQGLAAGTLIYVIFFEVLKKVQRSKWPYIAVFVGFIFMLSLQKASEYGL